MRFAPDADDADEGVVGRARTGRRQPGRDSQPLGDGGDGEVHDALPSVQAPTLVLRQTDDPMHGMQIDPRASEPHSRRTLHRAARLVHAAVVDAEQLLDGVEEFLTGIRTAPVAARVLATILFTDMVGRRRRLAEGWLGMVRPSSSTTRPCGVSSTATPARRSTPPATASSPSSTGRRARFARARYPKRRFGARAEVRAGLHTGEVERPTGGKLRGVAVNVAARVSGIAAGGEASSPRPSVTSWPLRPLVHGQRRSRAQGSR